MKNSFYLILFLLFSCNSENKTLTITFEHSNGIVVGDPVLIKDFQIGEVTKVSLNSEYKIKVEIELNEARKLPKDSKFIIASKDLLTKAIIVTPGKSKRYLSHNDKIIGQEVQNLKLDNFIDVFEKELTNSKPVKNQDSILSELQKMNKQIEELKKN